MSLNDIRLSASVVADLYSNVLVEGNTTVMPVKEQIRFLGKNQRNVLVVVDNSDVPFLHDEELNLLTSILSACHLSLADVAIINWNNVADKSHENLSGEFQPRQTILFDVTPAQFELPVDFPLFQVQHFAGTHYLCAPSLHQLKTNKEMKKQLWESLKRMFAIS